MRTAFMARPSRASISPSPIGAGEQRGRHFKAERTPDWLDRPWEDEQQVRMRLRPPEINVSVNYARLSINTAQLANALKLRRPGGVGPVHCGISVPSMSALGQLRRRQLIPRILECPLRLESGQNSRRLFRSLCGAGP